MDIQKVQGRDWTPRYLVYLAPVLMATMLVNQFLNLKSIDLFGVSALASIMTYPISLILCDILTEVYGYKRTRRLIVLCLALYALSMVFVQIAVYLPPANDFQKNDMFASLLGAVPQIALASVLGYLSGELVNAYVMSRLKHKTDGRFFFFRALASTGVSQIVNCLVFFGVGFWGSMSVQTIINSSGISIGLILAYESIALPLTHMIANRLKKLEGVDYFD